VPPAAAATEGGDCVKPARIVALARAHHAPSHQLYWLLLLLPTLAVGTVAIALLRREPTWLDERARTLAESQRAATERGRD